MEEEAAVDLEEEEALLEEEDEEEEDYEEEEEEAALAIPPLGTYLGAASGGGSPPAASASATRTPPRALDDDELLEAGIGDGSDEIVVYSWGQAAYSELGHGDNVERHAPTPIGACVCTCARLYTCACSLMLVWSARHRGARALTRQSLTDSGPAHTTTAYCRGKQIVAACAGNEHTALLSQDGVVHVCGYNDSGQVRSETVRYTHINVHDLIYIYRMTPLSARSAGWATRSACRS